SKQIEKAQRKVEEQNFLIRKRVLEYDDVMNEQRRVVYAYRDEILEEKPMGEAAREEIASVVERIVDDHTPGDFVEDWDLHGMLVGLHDVFPEELDLGEDMHGLDREELKVQLAERARELYDQREAEFGAGLML